MEMKCCGTDGGGPFATWQEPQSGAVRAPWRCSIRGLRRQPKRQNRRPQHYPGLLLCGISGILFGLSCHLRTCCTPSLTCSVARGLRCSGCRARAWLVGSSRHIRSGSLFGIFDTTLTSCRLFDRGTLHGLSGAVLLVVGFAPRLRESGSGQQSRENDESGSKVFHELSNRLG